MNARFNPEGERRLLPEADLENVRGILNEAGKTRQIDWEENGEEFIIEFCDRPRKYSKHNPLKKAEAEREINNLKQSGGLFRVNEDEDIYYITTYNRVVHVPKWEKVPLAGAEEKSLEQIIEAFLKNPAAGERNEITATVEEARKLDQNSKTDNIND